MGWFDRLLGWVGKTAGDWQRQRVARRTGPGEALFARTQLGGYGGYAGGPGTQADGQDRWKQVEAYRKFCFIAISAIQRHVCKTPPNIGWVKTRGEDRRDPLSPQTKYASPYYHRKALGAIHEHEEIDPVPDNHPLRRLIDEPNGWDAGWTDVLSELVMFLELTGEAYLWVPPSGYGQASNTGQPAEMWVLPTQWVWPRFDDFSLHHYDLYPVFGGGYYKIPPEQVIPFRYKGPLNKFRGWSKVQTGSEWIDAAASIDTARFWQFKNGNFPSGHIELSAQYADLSDAELERVYAKLNSRLQGEVRFGSPFISGPGVKFNPLTINPEEMAYGESFEQMRDTVMALFGVPKEVCALQDAGSEIAMYGPLFQFATQVVAPLLTYLGTVLTRGLARRYDRSLRIWWDDPTPENPQQLSQDLQQDAQLGMITPAEYRAARGRAPYTPEEEAKYSKIGQRPPAPGMGMGGGAPMMPGQPPGIPGAMQSAAPEQVKSFVLYDAQGNPYGVVKMEERRDSLNRRQCYDDGRHVPCHAEPESTRIEPAPDAKPAPDPESTTPHAGPRRQTPPAKPSRSKPSDHALTLASEGARDLPGGQQLAAGKVLSRHKGEGVDDQGTSEFAFVEVNGQQFFVKKLKDALHGRPMSPEISARNESLASTLATVYGHESVQAPPVRAVEFEGQLSVNQPRLQGNSLIASRQGQEWVRNAHDDRIGHFLLFSLLADAGDRHEGNYFFSNGRMFTIDHEIAFETPLNDRRNWNLVGAIHVERNGLLKYRDDPWATRLSRPVLEHAARKGKEMADFLDKQQMHESAEVTRGRADLFARLAKRESVTVANLVDVLRGHDPESAPASSSPDVNAQQGTVPAPPTPVRKASGRPRMKLHVFNYDEMIGTVVLDQNGALSDRGGVMGVVEFYQKQSGLAGADLLRYAAGRMNGVLNAILEGE